MNYNNIIILIYLALILSFPMFFIILRTIKVLKSPYLRANPVKRILAGIIDFAFCAIWFYAAEVFNKVSLYAIILIYILAKDCFFSGRSIGKLFLGLAVIKVKDGSFCTIKESVVRNLIYVIPGINIAGLLFEIILIIYQENGMRIGDRLAQTQVVEGMQLHDYSDLFQKILLKEIFQKEVQEN